MSGPLMTQAQAREPQSTQDHQQHVCKPSAQALLMLDCTALHFQDQLEHRCEEGSRAMV